MSTGQLAPGAAAGTVAPARGMVIADAVPYPWPYHGHFAPSRCALVACVDPQWRTAVSAPGDGDLNLSLLAGALRRLGAAVVWVTTLASARALPRAGTGVGAPPGLWADLAAPGDTFISAGGSNAFYGSQLDGILRWQGRTDLVLAGWGLEGPVHSTMRAANDQGYECLLVPDACSSLDPALITAACSMVQYSGGIFGAFANVGQVLDQLCPSAESGHEPSPTQTEEEHI